MRTIFEKNRKIIIIGSAGILSVAFILLGTPGTVMQAKAAGTDTNDVQYTTFLDYTPTDVLLEEAGFAASTTYDCSIATLNCSAVTSSTISLTPTALSNNSTAQISPDKTEALVPTYTPGVSPTETLYTIQGNSLISRATLPAINGLVTSVQWSSDDNVLLLTESDGVVQKYNATTDTLTTLTAIPEGVNWTTLSPNGEYLAYYIDATVSSGVRTYGIVNTDTDTNYSMSENVSYWDLLSEGVRIFAFSPDSTKLLYLDDRSGYQTLYEVDLSQLASATPTPVATLYASPSVPIANAVLMGTPITTKPYSMEDVVWENDSTILFSANRSNPMIWSLYEYNLDTYTLTKVDNFIAYNQAMELDGNNVIFQTADANGRMTHLYNILTKQVYNFNIPGVDQSKVGTANTIVEEDGVYGVYQPVAEATSTLLVWLHGGPDRQSTPDYDSYMSYSGYDWVLDNVQKAGVPVLKLDYPGSLGYGTAYAKEVVDGVGTVDASTTMQAISDFAASNGFKNIYVMGNSYGGYLALKLLVSYPNQIDGVFSDSGVTDWQTLLNNVPSSIFSADFNGPPGPANAQLYANASIVNNIANIGNQKIYLVQGNVDTEVPYGQSVLMNAALTAAGKNVTYTTLQGENHIYRNPSSYTLICNQTMNLVGLPDTPMCTMGS